MFDLAKERLTANLLLNTGERFGGKLIGAEKFASGELVFTTGMVGYCEALTDPSYYGQILVFSYPLIGNYGVPRIHLDRNPAMLTEKILYGGFEGRRIFASAVVMSNDCLNSFHWKYSRILEDWLREQNVPALVNVDTRKLVQYVRGHSLPLANIVPSGGDCAEDMGFFNPDENDLLPAVSCKERTILGDGKARIAVLDCGVKWGIIRSLLEYDCRVEVLPWDTDLRSVDCDGWLLSNGPGDPKRAGRIIDQVSQLLKGEKPILGICLGHQILALAAGAETAKMAFGHRGHNQPVYMPDQAKAFMTSQNHGHVVLRDSLPNEWRPWFINANDGTLEGIRHELKPFMGVQFHPEASGGPRDTSWIFREFIKQIET